jgi:hypothetical protein
VTGSPADGSGDGSQPSANWGQIIGYYWFYPPIIGNYWLLLQLLAIIGYYFLQKVFILLAIIATRSNINYCNYCGLAAASEQLQSVIVGHSRHGLGVGCTPTVNRFDSAAADGPRRSHGHPSLQAQDGITCRDNLNLP